MGFNPVASGILIGSITGAATGFLMGGPAGAAVGGIAGGISGGASAEEGEKKRRAGEQAQKQAMINGVKNQNALVEDQYNKKKQASGLMGAPGSSASGLGASQTGAVLTSVTGNEQVNLLG